VLSESSREIAISLDSRRLGRLDLMIMTRIINKAEEIGFEIPGLRSEQKLKRWGLKSRPPVGGLTLREALFHRLDDLRS
jgi:hypothetical protein